MYAYYYTNKKLLGSPGPYYWEQEATQSFPVQPRHPGAQRSTSRVGTEPPKPPRGGGAFPPLVATEGPRGTGAHFQCGGTGGSRHRR